MSITESDMKILNGMFMETAADLLAKEREILREMLAPITLELSTIKPELVEIKGQLIKIETRLTALEGRMDNVETRISHLVRFEEMERRIKVLEERAQQ